MNIGIDFDDTLINCNIIKETSHEFNFNLNEVKEFDWELSNFPIKLKEEITKRFSSPYYMCTSPYISFKPNITKKLDEWKSQGHKLILITARDRFIRNESRKLINKVYNKFDKIRFVNIGVPKTSLFKKEKLDIWIDDNPSDCKRSLGLKIETYMISNKTTPYNYNMKKHKNLNIVSEITDIKLGSINGKI